WITRFSSRSAPRPPHDGVRRARCLNLSRDLRGITALRFRTLNGVTSPIVPTGTTSAHLLSGGNCNSFPHAAAACLPQRNSDLSTHIRCRMTASLRATATREPQRLHCAAPGPVHRHVVRPRFGGARRPSTRPSLASYVGWGSQVPRQPYRELAVLA